MNTFEFLQLVTPGAGVLYAVEKLPSGAMIHHAAVSIPQWSDTIQRLDASGRDVYFALAGYDKPIKAVNARGEIEYTARGTIRYRYRTAAQVLALRSLWLDIDVGDGKDYATLQDATKAAAQFVKDTGLPRPLFVMSGGGLHIYWPLSKTVTKTSWHKLARRLKVMCSKFGLHADPTRTADAASVLRPVGSHNHKYSPPARVTTLNDGKFEVCDPAELLAILQSHVPDISTPTTTHVIPVDIGVLDTRYASNVVSQCGAIRHVAETGGNVPEPYWRAALGLLKFAIDGERYIDAWSSGYPGYTSAEAHQKYEAYSAGPPTCEFISAHSEACATCPHRGRITTPLVLGEPPATITTTAESTDIEEPRADTTPADDGVEVSIDVDAVALADSSIVADKHTEKLTLPRGYTILGSKLAVVKKDDSGEVYTDAFCNFTWAPYARVYNAETNSYTYKCRVYKGGVVEEFELPARDLGSQQTLLGNLAAVEIYPEGNMNASKNALARYTTDYCSRLANDVRPIHTYDQFGWTAERDGIVFGSNLITADGVQRAVLSGNAQRKASAFSGVQQDTKPWSDAAAELYGMEGAECMQYALLSGFGSLLGPFVGGDAYAGIPCAITSSASGIGKTTVAKLALSAFGDWRDMFLSSTSGATRQGRISTIAAFGNFPVLLDELTDIDASEFAELLYSVSNGRDRQRLSTSGELRDVLNWNSSVYITANENLINKLATMRMDTEANQVRVFEIDPSVYNVPMIDPIEADKVLERAMRARGAVGFQYLRTLAKKYNTLPETLAKVEKVLITRSPELRQPRLRFYRYHATCTITAGVILQKLGLISFDIQRLITWVTRHLLALHNSVRENKEESTTSEALLDELYRDLSGDGHLLVTKGYGARGRMATVVEIPRNKLEARFCIPVPLAEKQDKIAGDEEYEGCLIVSKAFLRKWCAERRMSVSDFLKRLPIAKVRYKSRAVRLASNTNQPALTATRCCVIKYADSTD